MTANGTAAERDELLGNLLSAAADLLEQPQVYRVAGGELRGHLALQGGEVTREEVARRRLPLQTLSVVCRATKDGIAYLGPVPKSDPCVTICSPALIAERGLVVVPVVVGSRTVCVLLGHPREQVSRELRDQMAELAEATAVELGKLAARLKRREPETEGVRVTSPYGHPAVKDPADRPDGAEEEVVLLTRRKPTAPADERRRHSRFPLRVQVSHVSEHNFFTGFTEDLGEGGLFIATHNLFQVGHRFELEFALPGQPEPWVVLCEVRWVRVFETDAKLIPGMGVSFIDPPPVMQEQIRRFMRKRPPLLHTERKP